jgi:predicted porin
MQRNLVAIALTFLLPLGAQAQSDITIYGTADASIGLYDTGARGEYAFLDMHRLRGGQNATGRSTPITSTT